MNKNEKALYKAKAAVFKALGHPTRLYMAEQLAGGERCVCEFVRVIDADFSTISKHLNILKQAGIVEDEKRGLNVYYKLKVPCILNSMSCVEAVISAQLQSQIDLIK
ncbi:MAG: metalloregulator ArsR/SmtB family transcription factor [Candidatus Neomarinimicrobiota bacterium]|jgi:ArsR family transcriptional regulator|nr:metalloregulator ArsR/SmtB family transcription factor [Candidatus Neomarinimicrobiota bacterium]MDD3967073.1 metalloregulator ArsR/SmtB family transcription factor [Candidatus Neomarinimicrobiota bacterium]MDX9780427.1 metalloregulator ArsR/SmtB family transcription factor [bacterium]